MSVLVDSPIWSLAFRRATATSSEALLLGRLAQRGEAKIIGAVRQEVLSGIRTAERFADIRARLGVFPDIPLIEEHYERAAEFCNTCRSLGVQGSHTDFLVCAAADYYDLAIFTTDADFDHFAKHIPVRRYEP